ncbi:MAG: tRNA pseudouridine(55) synthase TruB [Nitrospirota bacterium]
MNYVINLDKPKGITSQQAVTKVKKILGVRKAGHAGTLDPLATGLLIVCTGEATKITRFLTDLDKEYAALVKLGEKTNTFDSEGDVVSREEGFSFSREEIEEVLKRFRGAIRQTPPMFSAVKVNGSPLYKLARKGLEIERPEREITIQSLELTAYSPPFFEIRVLCSKGTYIRTLCNDIGDSLRVGAHVAGLGRTRTGNFSIENAISLDGLEELVKASDSNTLVHKAVLSPDAALTHMTEVVLSQSDYKKACNGIQVICPEALSIKEKYVRLKSPSGEFFGVGRLSHGSLRVERMLHL